MTLAGLFIPLQVTGVQYMPGRVHKHVRVFGYRAYDPDRKVMEVAVDPKDATEIMEYAQINQAFPEVEVPSRALAVVLNVGDMKVVRMEEQT